MSYAHTKRRKNIARLKKQSPLKWREELQKIADAVRRKNDGPLIGSLADIMASKINPTIQDT